MGIKTESKMAEIRLAAIGLLARREHSRRELAQKLKRRFGCAVLVESALEALAREQLQSDERFAEAFVSSRINKGQGPLRIAMALKEQGIGEDLSSPLLDLSEDEWTDLAGAVRQKRFGAPAAGVKERARQMRFLQYRGFTPEQIGKATKLED